MFGKAVIDQRRGEGWFSDPRGKLSLTRYGKELLEFALNMMFLRSKSATELAYEAAKSAPVASSGDGIMVSQILGANVDDGAPPQSQGAQTVRRSERRRDSFRCAVSSFSFNSGQLSKLRLNTHNGIPLREGIAPAKCFDPSPFFSRLPPGSRPSCSFCVSFGLRHHWATQRSWFLKVLTRDPFSVL